MSYFAQNEHDPITREEAYAYATGIIISGAFISFTFHSFKFFALNEACKMRVACSGLIYKKTLNILKASAEDGQNGKIINILSSKLHVTFFFRAKLPKFQRDVSIVPDMTLINIQTICNFHFRLYFYTNCKGDLARFDMAISFLYGIWEGPLQSLSFLVIIYLQIGWTGVIGLIFLYAFVPLQGK